MSKIAYDTENIFAKILRREMPAHKVYEDDATFAFMDIMPRGPGHTLVIPKAPSRNIYDVTPDALADVLATVQKIALAQRSAFGADGTTIQQFNEEAGGQIVFHLHFHVIPRFSGEALRRPHGEMEDGAVLGEKAAQLRAALEQK